MLKIRLALTGAKKTPNYRVVVIEARTPRQGRVIDTLGHFHPLTGPNAITIDQEKVKKWMSVGAQPTDAVNRILGRVAAAGQPEVPATAAPAAPKTDQ